MPILIPVTIAGKLTRDGTPGGLPLANISFIVKAKETIHADGRSILPVRIPVSTDAAGDFLVTLDTVQGSYRDFYAEFPDELDTPTVLFRLNGSVGSAVRFEILVNQDYPTQIDFNPALVSLIGTIVDSKVFVAGKSAYEIAVIRGFVGTEAAWLLSLRGANGANGAAGAVGAQGPQGIPGAGGASTIGAIPGLRTELDGLRTDINAFSPLPPPTLSLSLVPLSAPSATAGDFLAYIKTLPNFKVGKIIRTTATDIELIDASLELNVRDFGASGLNIVSYGTMASGSSDLFLTGAVGAAFCNFCFIGQSIFVPGAGSLGRGTDLVGKIVAVNRTNKVLTLDTAAVTAVAITGASGICIAHDDTDAMEAAITQGFANGSENVTILAPGFLKFNKGFKPSTNSLISPPFFQYTSTRQLRIVGAGAAPMWGAIPNGGSIFSTILTGTGTFPQFFGARAFASTDNLDSASYFNHLLVEMSDILFRLPLYSNIRAVALRNCIRARVRNVHVEPNVFHPFITTAPSNANNVAFDMPGTNNNVENTLIGCSATGQYAVAQISEHTEYELLSYKNNIGVIYERGYRHKPSILTVEHTRRPVDVRGQTIFEDLTVNGEVLHGTGNWYEVPTGEYIYDPQNAAHGRVSYNVVLGGFGNSSTEKLSVTGCSKVKFTNLIEPFIVDDGTINNAVVSRVLSAAPTYKASAIVIDEFASLGDLHGRRSDVLGIGANVWEVFGVSNPKILCSANNATVIEGYCFGTYDVGKNDGTAFVTPANGTSFNIIARRTVGGSCYAAYFNRPALTVQIYSFDNNAVGTPIGSPVAVPTGTEYGFKIDSAGVGTFYVDGTAVPTQTGLTTHTGNRMGFGGSIPVSAVNFQVV